VSRASCSTPGAASTTSPASWTAARWPFARSVVWYRSTGSWPTCVGYSSTVVSDQGHLDRNRRQRRLGEGDQPYPRRPPGAKPQQPRDRDEEPRRSAGEPRCRGRVLTRGPRSDPHRLAVSDAPADNPAAGPHLHPDLQPGRIGGDVDQPRRGAARRGRARVRCNANPPDPARRRTARTRPPPRPGCAGCTGPSARRQSPRHPTPPKTSPPRGDERAITIVEIVPAADGFGPRLRSVTATVSTPSTVRPRCVPLSWPRLLPAALRSGWPGRRVRRGSQPARAAPSRRRRRDLPGRAHPTGGPVA
jgi:hypothetical protein